MNNRIARSLVLGATGLALAAGSVVAAPAASASTIGNEGCTPGYWKNHTDSWLEEADLPIATSTPLASIYAATSTTGYGSTTMLAALSFGGGSGVDGAERILLRAATAAWLNAAHEDVGYPQRRYDEPGNIASDVNAALRSQDRAAILALAAELDRDNNLGCPLN